jgi:predicted dehydrogenase
MAGTYAEALKTYVNGGRLAAITGGSRAPALAAEYSVDCHPTLESLAARPDVDAIVLATPADTHLRDTRIAAAARKHVLVEKPMAGSVAACDEMIAACEDANVRLAVVKTERYRKLTLRAKELVDEGRIGPVWMLSTMSMIPEPVGRALHRSRPWFSHQDGGGLFMGMASHNADMLRWMSGRNAEKVFAQVNTFSDLPEPAQTVMAQIAFGGGIMAQMWISSEMPPPGLPSTEVRFQVVGGRGILDFENFEFLRLGAGDKWETIMTPERFNYFLEPKSPARMEPHIGVIQEFVTSIAEARLPAVTGADGRAAVEICEACLLSARSGKAIDLPLRSQLSRPQAKATEVI